MLKLVTENELLPVDISGNFMQRRMRGTEWEREEGRDRQSERERGYRIFSCWGAMIWSRAENFIFLEVSVKFDVLWSRHFYAKDAAQ